jgi:isoquinoline 1-oxidoreductase beta subunit
MHHAAFHQKREVLPVEVAPLEPDDLTSAKQKIERTYTTSTVMHFALEPVNALAFEKDGIFEIHTGNQWQTLILPVLAKALGRSQDKIVLRSCLLGGGFGRRLDGDYTVGAALAAKAIGKPVKMVCTRADDMRFDCPRSPAVRCGRDGRHNRDRRD